MEKKQDNFNGEGLILLGPGLFRSVPPGIEDQYSALLRLGIPNHIRQDS